MREGVCARERESKRVRDLVREGECVRERN